MKIEKFLAKLVRKINLEANLLNWEIQRSNYIIVVIHVFEKELEFEMKSNNWSVPLRMESEYKEELEDIKENLNLKSLNDLLNSVILAFVYDYREFGIEAIEFQFIQSMKFNKIIFNNLEEGK